jgi:hypothetical protein
MSLSRPAWSVTEAVEALVLLVRTKERSYPV